MILWLYDWLLALYPAEVRVAFGEEMRRVFLEAREVARSRGWWVYARFCAREVFGMLGGFTGSWSTVRYRWLIRAGALVGAVAGGVLMWQAATEPYVSKAVVRLSTPRIPEAMVAGYGLDVPRVNQMVRELMSRTSVTSVIFSFDLYPGERRRKPMQDVVEQFRRDCQVGQAGGAGLVESVWRISFSYGDRQVAQKVTQEMASRMIDTALRQESSRAAQTENFFADMMVSSGREMDAASEALNSARKRGEATERGALEAELARRQYEAMRDKWATAQMLQRVAERKQGAVLDIVDPASLPAERWETEYFPWTVGGAALAGTVLGAMGGWLVAWVLSQWPGRRPAAAV